MRNSSDRSVCMVSENVDILGRRTVDSFGIGKGLLLLRLVPVDDQSISESQAGSTVGSTGRTMSASWMAERVHLTHYSSQLYIERARVVSTCRTVSRWMSRISRGTRRETLLGRTSKSSFVLKPRASWEAR